MEEIKDRLKKLRGELKLKQREMADALRVTVSAYGAWETGRDTIPEARLMVLCSRYNVREEWLKTGEGEMFVKEELNAETLRRQIVALYNSLDAKGKAIFLAVAQGIVEAKDTKTACKNVDAAINGINNQGANYGQQSVYFGK